jgi:hypothetical protein
MNTLCPTKPDMLEQQAIEQIEAQLQVVYSEYIKEHPEWMLGALPEAELRRWAREIHGRHFDGIQYKEPNHLELFEWIEEHCKPPIIATE